MIEATGTAREVYSVVAETEAEARELFARGDLGRAFITEVNDLEIEKVEPGADLGE